MIPVQERYVEDGMTAEVARALGIDVPDNIPNEAVWKDMEMHEVGERPHEDVPDLVVTSYVHVGEWTWTLTQPKGFVGKAQFWLIVLDLWRQKIQRWIMLWFRGPPCHLPRVQVHQEDRTRAHWFRRPDETQDEFIARVLKESS